jgi:hypothetical protein
MVIVYLMTIFVLVDWTKIPKLDAEEDESLPADKNKSSELEGGLLEGQESI